MTHFAGRLRNIFIMTSAIGALSVTLLTTTPAPAQEGEPIAHLGHGGMFDIKGHEIAPTLAFVERAQKWYRERLISALSEADRREFVAFDGKLASLAAPRGQATALIRQQSLSWLASRAKLEGNERRIRGKINFLGSILQWQLPESEPARDWRDRAFEIPASLREKLKSVLPNSGGLAPPQATTNGGQLYLDECANATNQVPIPPSIGIRGPANVDHWTSQGFIPPGEQFIIGSPAEVLTFENSKGMCIALPRYNSSKTTVEADGVICLSKITSRVCIWDNQMPTLDTTDDPKNMFIKTYPASAIVPIGVPTSPGGIYQAGGAEIENSANGICTDCHAGENPYIVHPQTQLVGGTLFGDLENNFPMFGPLRYQPLVAGSWPQNEASLATPFVSTECSGCHAFDGSGQGLTAGRLPHLSNELQAYCDVILKLAVDGGPQAFSVSGSPPMVAATMPQFSPGDDASTTMPPTTGSMSVDSMRTLCNAAPDENAADRGDPHLTTVNGVHYDFQAAGEFVALRNSDTGFELQTRQTPVLTNFTPGPNDYTGLSSCVSLNTAAAARLGRQRVTFQPADKSGEQMELRVDGRVVSVPRGGLALADGSRIINGSVAGGYDLRAADGTRVVLTPHFWDSQSHWYLDVEAFDTRAREGTMGHILPTQWLPLAPNGMRFGPRPVALADRDTLLNQKFANAWRVSQRRSLFDYAPGTSTATFTDRSWPPPNGTSCAGPLKVASLNAPRQPPLDRRVKPAVAVRLCIKVRDEAARNECIFDMTVLGDPKVAQAFAQTLAARTAAQ